MPDRSVQDRLREEYFDLLPEIRRVAEHLDAEIRYRLLPISRDLEPFERIIVRSRVKECGSAIESLRRKQEPRSFDPDRAGSYTLTTLKDLAGVRILAFPRNRVQEIDGVLRRTEVLTGWRADPVITSAGTTAAFKYSGYYSPASVRVAGEYQVVSLLVGRFWEAEHSAMYKPSRRLQDAARWPEMQERYQHILRALDAFEEEFERLIRDQPLESS